MIKKHAEPSPTARIARRGTLYSVEWSVGKDWVPVEQSESLARAQALLAQLHQPVEEIVG